MGDWILKYWLQTAFGMLTAFVAWISKKQAKKIECKFKEQDEMKLAIHALLRDRIIQSYNYYTDRGYCPIYARDSIQNMFNRYHALGQNGVIKDLVQNIMELPTDKEGDK